jgi:3-methyladenine DNA glycosylase AlkC
VADNESYRLKDFYDETVVREIAGDILRVHPSFRPDDFVRDCLSGLDPLELVDRARHIAAGLRDHLPDDFDQAIAILLASLGPPLENTEGNGMRPFLYLPHAVFVATYGLDFFEASMRAQYELTQRFSAEFSIRAFLERYPERTLERLREWTRDPSAHVRRLVSEGTRPRLPWAARLRAFQHDPRPVLPLLDLLKDDPDLYVRRSVANNLNDIGKDHPDVLLDVCRAWWSDGSPDRQWLVRHALRSLVKQGDARALAILGYTATPVRAEKFHVEPNPVQLGERAHFAFDVVNESPEAQHLLLYYRVHFVKAVGPPRPKVFWLREVTLAPGERTHLASRVSFADLTTRRPYPGRHRVELLVNGAPVPLGEFEVVEPAAPSAP